MIFIASLIAVVATAVVTRKWAPTAGIALVAAIALAVVWHVNLNVTPRQEFSDTLGGNSVCVPVVSNGYDATFIFPWASDVEHQVGTTCWAVGA